MAPARPGTRQHAKIHYLVTRRSRTWSSRVSRLQNAAPQEWRGDKAAAAPAENSGARSVRRLRGASAFAHPGHTAPFARMTRMSRLRWSAGAAVGAVVTTSKADAEKHRVQR